MHAWLLILSSSRWVLSFPSLSLFRIVQNDIAILSRVVFFYLPVGGTLSSYGFAPSFFPPSSTATGIVEEVCFDRIKCNFRVPSTAFSLERLSAKPISCYKLWMELMRSAWRRGDFYILGATLWASFSHACAYLTFETYLMKTYLIEGPLLYFTNEKDRNMKTVIRKNFLLKNIWSKYLFSS